MYSPMVKYITWYEWGPRFTLRVPSSVMSALNGSCLWNKWTFMFLWNKKYREVKEALWLCSFPEAHSRKAFPTQALQPVPASPGALASKLEGQALQSGHIWTHTLHRYCLTCWIPGWKQNKRMRGPLYFFLWEWNLWRSLGYHWGRDTSTHQESRSCG